MQKEAARALIERAFNRATELDFFIARDLLFYRSLNGMGEEALSVLLRCTPESLHKLGLCRRPDVGSPVFRSQVQKIANFAGVDPVRLAALLRETETAKTMGAFSQSPGNLRTVGSLMAARDREEAVEGRKAKKSGRGIKDRKRK
jgi:hypothetical protein